MMRKRRTRQHQIEDLSYNFVELQVLEAFCILKRYLGRDYGYDAEIETFNKRGEVESGLLYVQVKATENLKFSKKHSGYELPLENRDMELWLEEVLPVLVVLFDAKTKTGYFVELHEHFKENRLQLNQLKKSKRIFISPDKVFNADAVEKYRLVKNDLNGKIKELQGDGTQLW